jgi:hypothetical protein
MPLLEDEWPFFVLMKKSFSNELPVNVNSYIIILLELMLWN